MITVELVAAISAGIVSVVTAVGALIAIARTKKAIEADAVKKDVALEEIHSLVNSRLSEALTEIVQLRTYIFKLTGDNPDEVKGNSPITPKVTPKAVV